MNLDCRSAREALARDEDGRRTDAESEALERHLAECASCASVRDEWRSIDALLLELGETPRRPLAPRSLPLDVSTARRLGGREWLFAIAAALLIGVTAWIVATETSDEPSDPATSSVAEVLSIDPGLLAVTVETTEPDVSFVWLYQKETTRSEGL
ncbi:MAG: zf-HC2 domain-containing protein [Planctomycetes bacterium]|nr:zf-HC2 domain-containing protein [Planctomycetota bacterium]